MNGDPRKLEVARAQAHFASFAEAARQLVSRECCAGKTTTHYLEEADALADRIIVVNRGVIVAEGSPSAIKTQVGGKDVRFIAEGLSREWLSTLPGVQAVSQTGRAWTILTVEPERVLREVFARDVVISGLEVQGAGLEEAVLALTKAHTPARA